MKDGWKPFFWRVLAITPSRFRPPSRSDDGSLAEHPQNHNLIKVSSSSTNTVLHTEGRQAYLPGDAYLI